tara:strand:- start:310 stop:471 length:162 start_codon:yes stop_codon:yes gene_type:complete
VVEEDEEEDEEEEDEEDEDEEDEVLLLRLGRLRFLECAVALAVLFDVVLAVVL